MSDDPSAARAILGYSFLRAFANDKVIDANELAFIERLALRDGTIDAAEQKVLSGILARIHLESCSPELRQEIEAFRKRHDIS